MWQYSAIPNLPCRARIHLFAPLPSQNSFTGSCTSRININFLLLNAGAATYEPPLGEICRPEPHVRSCPCVPCVLLAWGAPRLCFQGRRACRGGYLYSSYFAHFVSFVELLKLMEFGFYGWRAPTSLLFLFSSLPPFQRLAPVWTVTYNFTCLREHT